MAGVDWSALAPLVVRARQAQDRAAFDEIYRRVWELAFGFALKHYGRALAPEGAEDVVMQSFEAAWQELPQLKDPAAFGSWFFRLLARNCISACRVELARAVWGSQEQARFDKLVLFTRELAGAVAGAGGGGDPYRHLVRAELLAASKNRIMKVHHKLTDRQRLVFEARVLNLFDERESARRTGLPLGTIRSAYGKIIRRLKAEFQDAEIREASESERKFAFLQALALWRAQRAGGLGA